MKNRSARKILSIIGIVIAGYLGIILAQTVKRNHDLQVQITKLERSVAQLADEREELKYNVQYYKTEAFKEREARAKLGLMAPGEGEIILPKPKAGSAAAATGRGAKPKPNWQQWAEFLFG